jgi:hypothetical protein
MLLDTLLKQQKAINYERRPVSEMAAATMLVPPVWEGELLVTQHSIRFSFVKVESDVVFLLLFLPLLLLLLLMSRSLGQRAIAVLLTPRSCDTSEKDEIKINKTCRNYTPLLMLQWELISSFRLNS